MVVEREPPVPMSEEDWIRERATGQAPGWSRRKGDLPPGSPAGRMNLPPLLEHAVDRGARRLLEHAPMRLAKDICFSMKRPAVPSI
jgi:hypothetical protein